MSSGEIGVTEQELLRFASTLEDSLHGLVQAAESQGPPIKAGAATAVVEQVFAMYYSAAAGIAQGVRTTATDVATSREQYVTDDDEAAAGLPSLPLNETQQADLPVSWGQ